MRIYIDTLVLLSSQNGGLIVANAVWWSSCRIEISTLVVLLSQIGGFVVASLQNGGIIVAQWWSYCRIGVRQSPWTLPEKPQKISLLLRGNYGIFFFALCSCT